MKHFDFINKKDIHNIFYKAPMEFNKENTSKEDLAYCLGATLYMPSEKQIIGKLKNIQYEGLTSFVMCCEDAIEEKNLEKGEDNIVNMMNDIIFRKKINLLENRNEKFPLFFIRVRSLKQFKSFSKRLSKEQLNTLTGFIFPKFDSSSAYEYLNLLKELNIKNNIVLYGMPILESEKIIFKESREKELIQIKKILNEFSELVLNVRVGGTDFSSYFGVRRSIDYTIYDINVISDCLTDIMNYFGRSNSKFVLSAPVWEYFSNQRILKTELRKTPFNLQHKICLREEILCKATDGLIREAMLDKINGFVGKTIIHPTHIKYVNALQAVTKEEYLDAKMILESKDGGVLKSSSNNKMNEISPHYNWALKTIKKSKVYGVINNNDDYIKLF